MVKRQKPKPEREQVRRLCPQCSQPMAFAAEDAESVTLSCHGWSYQDFGSRARLWRTIHVRGAAVAHEWNGNRSKVSAAEAEPVPVA